MKTKSAVINVNSKECKYKYKAFGLNIASDICLNELMPASGECDIDIIYGIVPGEISEAIVKGSSYEISKNHLLFYVAGIGHYYIANGKKIIVQPDIDADESAIRLYLLGTAFGALLAQRGILTVHGSAVVIDGQCIVFTGASGTGKSTLSSVFRKMGYSFLADDVSAITFDDDGIAWVQPAYPQQKLCKDSCEAIEGDISCLKLIDLDTDKYAVPVQKGFLNFPVRLAAICELSSQDGCNLEMNRIVGAEKLSILMSNIYRAQLITYFKLKKDFFRQCIEVAKVTAFYRLKRPQNKFLFEEQVSLIREKLGLLFD